MIRRLKRHAVVGALAAATLASGSAEAVQARVPVRTGPIAAPMPPVQAGSKKMRHRDEGSFLPPVANSAWQALGFNKRFFKVGDAWRIAWSARKRRSILKRTISQGERANPSWSAPIFVDYRVSKVTTQTIAGRKRQVAQITAIYGNHLK